MYEKCKIQRWNDAVRIFWSKVDILGIDECWEWKGSVSSTNGYGQSYNGKISLPAHKMSWMINKGPIPKFIRIGRYDKKALIRHICNNKLCVNPNHLELGTYADNANDIYRTGNRVALSDDDVRLARKMKKDGNTYRYIGKYFNTTPQTVRKAILGKGIYCEVVDDNIIRQLIK